MENIYKKYRKLAGLTQEKAAEHLNISVDTIKRYENGTYIPQNDIARRMCLLYGDGRGSIKRFDQVLDFSVENMDKVYLRDSTKSYHDEFSIYNGNDKVICRSLSINELGIQADIHYYFDKDNNKGHDLDIIAINDQGDRIRLSPMIGNGQGDSDIRYIMRTMTSQNKDISRFLKSSYIILEAYKVKGEENIKPETFVEELDKDIKYIEDNNAFNNENTSENRDINRNLYSYEKIGQSKKIKL